MIRKALPEDMPVILKLYEQARRFMAEHGNPWQWGNTSPAQNVLEEDIRKERLYLCERDEKICGVFAFPVGEDPTYAKIEGGGWKLNTPYGTIHRMAGNG